MLTHNDQVRLTTAEQRQLSALTGEDASNIKTLNQLVDYIHAHNRMIDKRYCGPTACFARRILTSFLPAECG